MIELNTNLDKNNAPTIIFNSELLFDTESYIINRLGEIDKKGIVKDIINQRTLINSKFPNMTKEMDISSDFFELKRLFEELLDKGYNVVILNIVPNHNNIALGLTQRDDRLKYFLGKDLCKRCNVIALDHPQYARRYSNDKTFVITDNEVDYCLALDGKIVEFTWVSNLIPEINSFLERIQSND